MKDSAQICQILMQKTGHGGITEKYGFGRCCPNVQIVIALYEDQTWEKIAAFVGPMYNATDKKQPPRLGRRLLNKTRHEASEILDEYFAKYQINGKNLIKKGP